MGADPAVAAVLRDERRRVLIQRNHHGQWSLPAGAIEPGEAPAQAVVREVFEETGLYVKVERVLAVVGGASCRVSYPNGDRVEYTAIVFECRRLAGAFVECNDETAHLEWFPPDEIPALSFPYPEGVLRGDSEFAHFEWDDSWVRLPE